MQTVVFGNQKGGAGKTTCTANFAILAADAGLRVLAIDIDPQGHLTESFLLTEEQRDARYDQPSLGDLLDISTDKRPAFEDVVIREVGPNLDLLPSSERALERAEQAMDSNPLKGLTAVRDMLRAVADQYDLVVIDSPPRLTSLATGPLVAATAVVVPMEPVTFHFMSTITYIAKVNQVAESPLNPGLRLLGVLFNKYKADAEETKVVRAMIEEEGWPLLDTAIPESLLASKAVLTGNLPAAYTYPYAPFAKAFSEATTEILDRLVALAQQENAS